MIDVEKELTSRKKWKNGRSIHIELAHKICQTHDERQKSIEVCKQMLCNLQADASVDYSKYIIPRSLVVMTGVEKMTREAQIDELKRAIQAQQTLVVIVNYAIDCAVRDIKDQCGTKVAEDLKKAIWQSAGSPTSTKISSLVLPEQISMKAFKRRRFLMYEIILSAFGGMPYTRDFFGYKEKGQGFNQLPKVRSSKNHEEF